MTKMTKKQITKTVLEAVATEFNSVILDEESGIQTGKDVAKDDLQADVIEVAGIIEATDLPNLSEKTLEVLSVLGVELPEATETEPEEKEVVEEVVETKNKKDAETPKSKKHFQPKPGVTERNKLIESLIKTGNLTAKGILEAVLAKYPDHPKGGITTVISDSKNPKYNKFSKLAKMDSETKILSF